MPTVPTILDKSPSSTRISRKKPSPATKTKPLSSQLPNLAYRTAAVLVFIGVLSALSPYIFPPELYLQIVKPLYGEAYVAEQLPKLSTYPVQETVHRLLGSAYMIIGLLQFTPQFRKKHYRRHRILGRIFVVMSLLVGLGGMVMSVFYPFAGPWEAVPTLLFGAYFLVSTYLAYHYARRRKIKQHQHWMVRSFSLALAISTIRIVFLASHQLTNWDQHTLFIASIWVSWILHVIFTEAGIYLANTSASKARKFA